jgi:hypothetical protein
MDRAELIDSIRVQAGWCQRLGSPLYHGLLERIAENVESSGACWKVLEPHAGDPRRSLLHLRLLGGVHRRVLEGRLPELAKYYPSAGGTADPEAVWPAFLDAIDGLASIPKTVQTNEVTRCCALLPGFLEIARVTGLPLRLLEIGASAGLNLRWDRYRYRSSERVWGDPNSSVVFDDATTPDDTRVEIAERLGCDLHPVDPASEDGRLTLLSFVWPDQVERFRNLANAIDVARAVPAAVDCADAADWLEPQLAGRRAGFATVVFHSIVMLYLDENARSRVASIIGEAGARATTAAPLAWLAMEPGADEADVHLTIWPGGERRRIATAGFHGRNVKLLAANAHE